MKAGARRFKAVLERLPGGLGWTVARVPFDPAKVWKGMVRRRVVVEAGGESFRTSLFAETGGSGYFVLVNKSMQRAAGVRLGGMVELSVAPDMEEREVAMPGALERILKKEKTLAKWYAGLSESRRREIGKWVDGVKGEAARVRRAEQTAEWLMLAMEAEKVLPPVIEAAFRRVPAARKGWEKMTPVQRQGHLLGVFHYRSPESREKRVGKLVEDCLKVAERG